MSTGRKSLFLILQPVLPGLCRGLCTKNFCKLCKYLAEVITDFARVLRSAVLRHTLGKALGLPHLLHDFSFQSGVNKAWRWYAQTLHTSSVTDGLASARALCDRIRSVGFCKRIFQLEPARKLPGHIRRQGLAPYLHRNTQRS